MGTVASSERDKATPTPATEDVPPLADIEALLRSSELVGDRRHRMRTYKGVVVGADVVNWMVSLPWCGSRDDAVHIGQRLLDEGLLSHVTHGHAFKDEYMFYRCRGTKVDLNAIEAAAMEFDIVVVGAGGGGIAAASFAAELGARVALVERAHLGGDCTWTGCVPSKALLHAAKVAHHARQGRELGVSVGDDDGAAGTNDVRVDMGKVRDYVYKTINSVYKHESPDKLEAKGVRVFVGEASFVDAHSMNIRFTELRDNTPGGSPYHKARGAGEAAGASEAKCEADDREEASGGAAASTFVNGSGGVAGGERVVTSHHFLLCTGARAFVPPIPGLDATPYITYENIFDNADLPASMAVVGGGPIGVELGQAYARFGCKVTFIASRLLAREEEDVRTVLTRVFAREGIEHVAGRPTSVERLEGGRVAVKVGDVTVTADQLLVATGRRPNVESLALENAGVEFTAAGITVDDKLRTNVKHIYAAGDVTGSHQFTHYAGWQAWTAARNILAPGSASGHTDLVPWVTFTSPEVGKVGPSLEEATKQYGAGKVRQVRLDNSHNDRSVCDDDLDGFISLIVLTDGTIVGATVVAERAGEMLSEICVAVKHKMTLKSLASVMHPYPAYNFGVMLLAANTATEDWLNHSTSGSWVKSMYGRAEIERATLSARRSSSVAVGGAGK